jgi:hypothetical protein
LGATRRLYYRLDVAIDAAAMRRTGEQTATTPARLLDGQFIASEAERGAAERVALEGPTAFALDGEPDAAAGGDQPSDASGAMWAPLDRARILDISGTGMQLQAWDAELRAGDQVLVAFPFGGRDYRLSTEVMWARRSQFGGATRVGLRFQDIDERERELLVRAIYRAQRSAGRVRRR